MMTFADLSPEERSRLASIRERLARLQASRYECRECGSGAGEGWLTYPCADHRNVAEDVAWLLARIAPPTPLGGATALDSREATSALRGLPDVEAVAAKVHEAWMASKRRSGVTSRRSEHHEELMVPYGDLSEAAKDLDRASVQAVYAALAELGADPRGPAPTAQSALHGQAVAGVPLRVGAPASVERSETAPEGASAEPGGAAPTADALVSALHDIVWRQPVSDDRQAMNDLIWKIHEMLRGGGAPAAGEREALQRYQERERLADGRGPR